MTYIRSIIIKRHSNVPLSELVNRTHDSAMQTRNQGHTLRSMSSAAEAFSVPHTVVFLYTIRCFLNEILDEVYIDIKP